MPPKRQPQKRQRDDCPKAKVEVLSTNDFTGAHNSQASASLKDEVRHEPDPNHHSCDGLNSPKEQSTERDDTEIKEAKLLAEGEKLSGQKLKDFLKKNFLDFADEQEAILFAHVDPELMK